jgi:hypothetical protein
MTYDHYAVALEGFLREGNSCCGVKKPKNNMTSTFQSRPLVSKKVHLHSSILPINLSNEQFDWINEEPRIFCQWRCTYNVRFREPGRGIQRRDF